jgi:hypothetical protein
MHVRSGRGGLVRGPRSGGFRVGMLEKGVWEGSCACAGRGELGVKLVIRDGQRDVRGDGDEYTELPDER